MKTEDKLKTFKSKAELEAWFATPENQAEYNAWKAEREASFKRTQDQYLAEHPEIPCRVCGTTNDLDGNAHKGEKGELCYSCQESFAETDDWTGNFWDYQGGQA